VAHYAFLDENNIVTQVIVGKNEDDLAPGVTSWEEYYGDFKGLVCKRTSYNTRAGQHEFDGTPYRGNYAGIGYLYREDLDAFIPPTPYPSWVLDEDTCLWVAPIAYPADADTVAYIWDEDTISWIAISDPY
jgi:hypothetical protein